MSYPSEFFLGNLINLEPGRLQKFPICWAYATASLIGDTLSLQEKISPVIPSTMWITSMRNRVCREYHPGDSLCNLTTFEGYFPQEILYYMSKNSKDFYAKLEKCFSQNDTIDFIEFENFMNTALVIPIQHMVIDYLGYMYPDCCLKEETNIFQCQKPVDILSELHCKFNVKIKDVKYIKFLSKEKNNITEEDLKFFQNIIKYILYCRNKPILSTIIITNEYFSFLKNELPSGNTYFIPTTEILSKEDMEVLGYNIDKHAIIIYGWEKKDGIEYWIVRDSNSTKYGHDFYKIPFSTILNREYWIGCDIDWISNSRFRVSSQPTFIDVEVDEDDLLKMMAFSEVDYAL